MNAAHQSRPFTGCLLMFTAVVLSSHWAAAQGGDFEAWRSGDPFSLDQLYFQQPSSQRNPPQQQTAESQPAPPQAGIPRAENPCVQPARIFIAEEYTGPLKKVVSYFARKPEIKTVYVHRRDIGARICALAPSQKFNLFVRNSIHPVTFIAAGWDAGIAQAADDDPTFGQGAEGYGKRYGAALADRASRDFFHTFALPVIFRQDPRYYRQGYGSGHSRLRHAVTHVFVARSDSGHPMFNFSEWLGTASAVALSNTYHPGNRRGFAAASERVGINVASDAGFDILREFWPEVVRRFKLPFRIEPPANGH